MLLTILKNLYFTTISTQRNRIFQCYIQTRLIEDKKNVLCNVIYKTDADLHKIS